MILIRIEVDLELNQSEEQAGFRKGYSTLDHILSLNLLIEKFTEFNKTLHIAFIDFEKAFDSVEIPMMLKALANQNIQNKYIKIIKHIYENSEANIKLDIPSTSNFKLERGVKQGDPMSPKLFNAVLEEIFKSLKWSSLGLNIDGLRLSNLRFADDVVLMSESNTDLLQMVKELKLASAKSGLKINKEKTKILSNSEDSNFTIDDWHLEKVEGFKYLEQILAFKNKSDKEIDERISAAWRSFWTLKRLLISDLTLFHKRKLMDSVILPVSTYGAQSWTLKASTTKKIAAEQKAMERKILKISLLHHKTNDEIRSKLN